MELKICNGLKEVHELTETKIVHHIVPYKLQYYANTHMGDQYKVWQYTVFYEEKPEYPYHPDCQPF